MSATMTTTNGTTEHAAAIVRNEEKSIQPVGFGELRALAKDAADSNFFGAKNASQALMVMMAGRDLGLTYTQALRAFHVIEGRPSLSAAGMVAVCLGHPDVCEYVKNIESTDDRAVVEVKRVGNEPHRVTFTMADAQRAKLVKPGSAWEKYPSRMLLARARSFACHDEFEDLLAGLYDPDELTGGREEPRRIESVVESTPVVEPQPNASEVTTNEFLAKIAEATSQKDLDAVAKLAQKASREGIITDDQFLAVGQRVKVRRAEIA